MIYFSIKDLESFSGIKAHTIRTWEQRFTFLRPKRSEGLRRTYDCDELKLILNISFLNRNGYKVSRIARMSKEEMNTVLAGMADVSHTQDKAVNELICCMAVMDIDGFNTILQSCEMEWGIDVTLTGVVVPFSKKTGLLKQKDNRNYEAHLLLVEQNLKQKIIVGIEKPGTKQQGQTALFFLSKKKTEIELLYLQYTLKSSGFTIIYISSPITFSQLCAIAASVKPEYIITSTGGKSQQIDTKSMLDYLGKQLPQTVFLNLEDNEALPFEDLLITRLPDGETGMDV
jgi:DNA-binding transcriptional MerR regulator